MNRFPPMGEVEPLVVPLYQSAVYSIPSLDACDRIYEGSPGFIYARDSHPNAKRLAQLCAEAENAQWGVVTGSGMAAISAMVLPFIKPGDRILASNRLYGRTNQLFNQELPRFGVGCQFVDCNELAQVEKELRAGGKIVFVETISNPLLRVPNLKKLAKLCQDHQALLMVDNTFATPVLCKPLDMGADLVMESLTKVMSGHSDVTLGLIVGNNPDMLAKITPTVTIWGFASNPFDCWLAERGLETMTLRMTAACQNAARLADWLVQQPNVLRVLYPGRADHADHAIASEVLSGGFGNMLCFEVKEGRDGVNRFLRQAPGVPFSPSLGHTSTTLSHPYSTSHRFASDEDRRKQTITEGLVRLSVGCEDYVRLEAEMAKGLA